MNWRGRPLTSHEVIVQAIAATTTRTGLTVQAELDTGLYPTGVKVSDQQMAALPITPRHFHHDWNYTLHPHPAQACGPAEPGPQAPSGWDHATLAHPALTGLPPARTSATWPPRWPAMERTAGAGPAPAAGQRPATGTRSRRPAQADARRPGPGHPPPPAPRSFLPSAGPAARGEPHHHQPGSPGDPAATGPARARRRRAASSPPLHTGRHFRVRRQPRHHAPAGIEISVLILCEPLCRYDSSVRPFAALPSRSSTGSAGRGPATSSPHSADRAGLIPPRTGPTGR
jgi:Rhodopirellula transposase DDE domain